ncbi:MAG: tetratricopeptide repeat protein [Planctomycetes bacterium]|nr:tetratricopeptide repeat protein [Planctomycetota bacterium]
MKTDLANSFIKTMILGFVLVVFAACSDKPKKASDLLKEADLLHHQASISEKGMQPDQWQKVEILLREAVALEPDYLPAHCTLVRALWDQEKHLEAIHMIQDLNTRFPHDAECWELTGDLFFKINQWEKAVDAFQQAIDQGGDPKTILIKKGTAAGKSGNFELAFETFDEAIRVGGAADVIQYNLGLCYEGTKEYEMALHSFEQALTENPSYLPANIKLMEFHQNYIGPFKPDTDAALFYAKKAYELNPADIKVLSNLADIFMSKEDYDSAMELVEKALILHPKEPELEKYKIALEKLIQNESSEE